MPHKCVKCDRLYGDDATEVIKGCACGAKAFLFVRPDRAVGARSIRSAQEGDYDIDIRWLFHRDEDARIVAVDEGQYEIDLAAAFGKRPNV